MFTDLPIRKESTKQRTVSQSDYRNWCSPERELQVLSKSKKEKASRLQWTLELNSAVELERKRLARELHDQVGQDLAALSLGFSSLEKKLSGMTDLKSHLENLQIAIVRLDQHIHDIASELRPLILDDLGLKEALLGLLEKLSASVSVKTNLQAIEIGSFKLSKFAETELYRIIQEAVTNIIKHARAKNVMVKVLKLEKALIINVEDDGCGFDISALNDGSKKKCFGILGIQERVALLSGELNIITSLGNGTTLKISLPVQA